MIKDRSRFLMFFYHDTNYGLPLSNIYGHPGGLSWFFTRMVKTKDSVKNFKQLVFSENFKKELMESKSRTFSSPIKNYGWQAEGIFFSLVEEKILIWECEDPDHEGDYYEYEFFVKALLCWERFVNYCHEFKTEKDGDYLKHGGVNKLLTIEAEISEKIGEIHRHASGIEYEMEKGRINNEIVKEQKNIAVYYLMENILKLKGDFRVADMNDGITTQAKNLKIVFDSNLIFVFDDLYPGDHMLACDSQVFKDALEGKLPELNYEI